MKKKKKILGKKWSVGTYGVQQRRFIDGTGS